MLTEITTWTRQREPDTFASDGPWDDEPDKVQWIDTATDLDALAVRNRFGSWCGYVGVPESHPLFAKDTSECLIHGMATQTLHDLTEPMRELGYMPDHLTEWSRNQPVSSPACDGYGAHLDSLLAVHGGVTFTGFCQSGDDPAWLICHQVQEGRPDPVWWIGFDCGHTQDYLPSQPPDDILNRAWSGDGLNTYRDLDYVRAEVTGLARQLKDFDLATIGCSGS